MFKHTGFYVFKIRYMLMATAIIVFGGVLLTYFYLTSLVDTRTMAAMSLALNAKTIAIDPGHGGYDPGAKGTLGTEEKDLTLQISQKLADKLNRGGGIAFLIRNEDVDLVTPGPGTKKKRDLDNRLKKVTDNKADILISIHLNSFGSQWSGSQTFYNSKLEKNKVLAKFIQDELKTVSNSNREILTIESSYLLNNADIPACIVEVGFLSNPKEEKKLLDPVYQDALADGIYRGIVRYMASGG